MKLYRADKRNFSIGDKLETAGEFQQKNPEGSHEIESIFESMRPSEKPQRAHCLYLFENLDAAKKHWSKMTDGKLYEVDLDVSKILHRADMQFFDMAFDSTDINERIKHANSYWSGIEAASPIIEILTESAVVSGIISQNQSERRAYLRSCWALKS